MYDSCIYIIIELYHATNIKPPILNQFSLWSISIMV